jgi:hypothetical protein
MSFDSYKQKIQNLAENRVNEMFYNTDAEHATVVLTELIKNAEKYVYIVAENMDPVVTDNEEYLKAVDFFLCKKNVKMKILLTDYNKEKFHSSKIGTLLNKYEGIVEIKNSEGKKIKREGGIPINFTVSDNRAFRFERDVDNHIAFGNFNDKETASILASTFNNLFPNECCKVVSLRS